MARGLTGLAVGLLVFNSSFAGSVFFVVVYGRRGRSKHVYLCGFVLIFLSNYIYRIQRYRKMAETVSTRISRLLATRPLLDPEDDGLDEVTARTSRSYNIIV